MAYAHRKDFARDNHAADYRASGEGGEQYRIEPHQDDWNALRDELETLLEQVNVRQRHQDPPPQTQPFSLRAPDPPALKAERRPAPSRRQEALNSVQRAVNRFSEPSEAMPMPTRSDNQLQTAIEQIRASQNHPSQGTDTPRARSALRVNPGRFEHLDGAMAEMNTRFSRIEKSIGSGQNSARAIEDMAVQIEQLSSVVELLAGSVGERGQIKRIEEQISKLANAVSSGPGLDFGSINERLDVLCEAFEQLAMLRSEGIEPFGSGGAGEQIDAIQTGVRNLYERFDELDLAPIEASVRSIYSRMDAIEEGLNSTSPAIERLNVELAEFTRAMQAEPGSVGSASIATRISELNQRVAQIEGGDEQPGGLHAEMEALQSALLNAMEPKFSALEDQIGSLSDTFGSGASLSGEQSGARQLEEQIRALGKKMDQTGAELSQLHQLYQDGTSDVLSGTSPDFTAIADMVAMRTHEAMREELKNGGDEVSQQAMEGLETRLSDLIERQGLSEPGLVFSSVQNSIDLVNQRLERLESTLNRHKPEMDGSRSNPATPAAISPNPMLADARMVAGGMDIEELDVEETVVLDEVVPEGGQARRPRHPGLTSNSGDEGYSEGSSHQEGANPGTTDNHLLAALKDTMPRSPTKEAPLNAPVYPPPTPDSRSVPVPDPLRIEETETMILDHGESDLRKLAEEAERARQGETPGTGRIKLPQFETNKMVPPPEPRSSFTSNEADMAERTGGPGSVLNAEFSTRAYSSAQDTPQGVDDEREKVSRSTFIEAARRAAKSNNPENVEPDSQSLIGRALARFQKKLSAEKEPVADDRSTQTPHLPGDRPETLVADTPSHQHPEQLDVVEVRDSFLVRHRQPILLVATMLAVSMLALNLFNQRFSPANGSASASIAGIAGGVTPAGPKESPSETVPGPGDVVGSIEIEGSATDVPVRVIDPALISDMPPTLDLASLSPNRPGNLQQMASGPSLANLPPDALGPMELRQSAADGDARAQFEVAAIFAEGRAVAQDLGAAALWYERAAAQGYAPAAYRLGNMFENGVGVAKDLEQARLWYQKAADAGNRMSMHNLASLLAGGGLGEQKFGEAALWFEQAAALGLKDSQFNLGMLHARGLGVPQNLEESFRWFSIAAAQGDEDAGRARDDVLRSLDAQTVARLHEEIKNWTQGQMDLRANFAPIGTWSESFDPGPSIDNREIVLRVQAALNKLGFDAGTPDGLVGPKTVEAISAFEQATGMSQSGEVNPRLLSVLGSQPV